jgi:hypothetical protein
MRRCEKEIWNCGILVTESIFAQRALFALEFAGLHVRPSAFNNRS